MSLEYNIFINGVYQGTTSELYWNIYKIYTVSPLDPFPEGYYLPMPFSTAFIWRVDTYDTETDLTTVGDNWLFTTEPQPTFPPFIDEKPPVEGNTQWIPNPTGEADAGDWEEIEDDFELYFAGGGRYRKRTVVITFDNSGNGKILVGD